MTDAPHPPSPHDMAYAKALTEHATGFFRRGDAGLAEAYAREAVRAVPGSPLGHAALGALGLAFGQPEAAWRHFHDALAVDPGCAPARLRLERLKARHGAPEAALDALRRRRTANHGKTILVKAWAYGFWSDVFHVLGQALLGEITGRAVVTDWGRASLYWYPDAEPDVFRRFFLPLSPRSAAEVRAAATTVWPPKWRPNRLEHEVVDRWFGKGARLYGPTVIGRDEDVAVSDFFTSAHAVARWLPSDHPYFAAPFDDLVRHLFRAYLRPRPIVADAVSALFAEHLAGRRTLAVHVRGDNKAPDAPDISEINEKTAAAVARLATERAVERVLLITDSNSAISRYRALFGERLVTTDALRPENERSGIYLERDHARKKQAALDVLIDTYLAARCDAFIGNGWSNVSVAVHYAGDFADGDSLLIGANVAHEDLFNLYIPREEPTDHDRFDIPGS